MVGLSDQAPLAQRVMEEIRLINNPGHYVVRGVVTID